MNDAHSANTIRVPVKLGGALVRYKPDKDHVGNQIVVTLPATEATLARLLTLLDIPPDARLMIIINGTVVHRHDADDTHLGSGDSVALVPPIQAG